MIIKPVIFLLASFFSLFAFTMDESTESYDGSDDEAYLHQANLCPVDPQSVAADLKDPESVRYQIAKNLAQRVPTSEIEKLLIDPIVCIGTGTNIDFLRVSHKYITRIREEADISIDIRKYFDPHIVADAFGHFFDLSQIYGKQIFGVIFFAHVSDPVYAFTTLSRGRALARYFAALKDGGYLVFNSEVYSSRGGGLVGKNVFDVLAKANGFRDLKEVHFAWHKLLRSLNFVNIKFFVKDESKVYGANAASVLLIAQKPVRHKQ